MPSRETLERFIAAVESRDFLESIREFYADHATMQENLNPPRVGMTALLENEQRALNSFQSPPAVTAKSFLVDGDRVAINWIFEYRDLKGQPRKLDEIAYQLWEGEKIVTERYFYDPSSVPQPAT
jgi:hypothetical protein